MSKRTRYVSDFDGDLQLCLNECAKSGSAYSPVVVDAFVPPAGGLGIHVTSSVDLDFETTVAYPTNQSDPLHSIDVGFCIDAPCFVAHGHPGIMSLSGTALSGFMFNPGADNCLLDGVWIDSYHLNDIPSTNGHAAVFTNSGLAKPVRNFMARHCHTSNGNGNGLRIGGVIGALLYDNLVENTKGQSAEGVTIGGFDIRVIANRILSAWTCGLLAFNGDSPAYRNLTISQNLVKNCGQANLTIPPQASFAFALNPQGNAIDGVVFTDNLADDDQAVPTQTFMLALDNSGKGGVLMNGRGGGNVQKVKDSKGAFQPVVTYLNGNNFKLPLANWSIEN